MAAFDLGLVDEVGEAFGSHATGAGEAKGEEEGIKEVGFA
jgi:hypothetical protein